MASHQLAIRLTRRCGFVRELGGFFFFFHRGLRAGREESTIALEETVRLGRLLD